jgi:hypothetical protein
MHTRRVMVASGVVALAAAWVAVPAASAANGPTFRDCALPGGLDPDFVQLFGPAVTPQGTLTLRPSQKRVQLEASESSDPKDNEGHVTLTSTVTGPHGSQTVSGAGTGKVFLSIPLAGSGTGKSFTISWAATFDNGFHECPSDATPENTTPKPFVVTVGT